MSKNVEMTFAAYALEITRRIYGPMDVNAHWKIHLNKEICAL
jgi:hypothetical protein